MGIIRVGVVVAVLLWLGTAPNEEARANCSAGTCVGDFTAATTPLTSGSDCFYVAQGISGGTGNDRKLCSGYAAAIGALTATNNLSDLTNGATARTNLGLGALATLSSVNLATQVSGNLPIGNLNGGTSASSSTFWRGDGTWATPAGSGGGGLTIGTTTITGGTSGRVLYDTSGIVGELAVTGSGNVVESTSPSLTAPTIAGGTLSSTFSGTPTFSGNVTFSGVPLFTGISSGTVASGSWLGLDSGNNLVKSTPAGSGNVSGPGSSTVNDLALWNNTGGTLLKDATLSSVLDQIGSTQGGVLYRGASVWSYLAPGTNGQFLQTQGGGLNPQWATISGGGSGTVNSGTSGQGAYYASSTNAVSGSAGLTLSNTQVTGMAVGLGSDATGDIYYRNSGGSLARLGVGSTGQFLGVSGGLPAWGTPAGSAYTPTFYVGTVAGTNTYTSTPTQAYSANTAYNQYCGQFANANTGAATLNLNSVGAVAINKAVNGALVALKGGEIQGGNTVQCMQLNSGVTAWVLQPKGGVTILSAGTHAVTLAEWAYRQEFDVPVSGVTITVPQASTLALDGGIVIKTIGQTATLTPANGSDGINGGTAGASVTVPNGILTLVSTSGADTATAFYAPLGVPGSLLVTDGTNSVANTLSLTLGQPAVVSGSGGSATVNFPTPNRTVTGTGGNCTTITATSALACSGDMAGQVNLASGASGFTISAISGGVFPTGGSLLVVNVSGSAQTITNTATVNGQCAGSTYTMQTNSWCAYTSNGTSIDSFAFPGFAALRANSNTWTGVNTFSGGILATDIDATGAVALDNTVVCGSTINFNSTSPANATVASTFPAHCGVAILQTNTAAMTVVAGTGTVNSACSTIATNARYATIIVKSEAAGAVTVDGRCT